MALENSINNNNTEKTSILSKIQTDQIKYCLIFIPLFLAYIGNVYGGIYTLLGVGSIAILTILDFVIKDDSKTEIKDERNFSNQILFGVALMQLILAISFLWGVKNNTIDGMWFWTAILSTGFGVALCGAGGAHELIHRRSDLEKNIGTLQLSLLLYGHHTVEHIQGHHRHIATDEDPSSPAKGTNFYSYLILGYIKEIQNGYKMEAERLIKKSKKAFSFENQVVKWWSLTLVFFIISGAIFGIKAIVGYILISLIFVIFHAAVVYSQHYGLRREEGERVGDTHSWQTNSLITEYFLLGFGNHSDHHTRVTKTYAEIIQKEDGPRMPFGYFGSLVVVMMPPLWFSIVDKRIK